MTTGRSWPAVVVVAAMLVWSGSARAGGFEYGTDNGAYSLSRGGASTALPGMAALFTNVAGIADTPRIDIYSSANLVFRNLRFQRAGFRAVEDETPIFVGPMLAAALRLTPNLVLGLGIHGPAAVGEGHYDHGTALDPGPSRYLFTDHSFAYVYPTLALAFTLPSIDGLRIGLGFQPSIANAAFTIYAGTFGVDMPGSDVRVDADVWDFFVPAFQIGFLYAIGERIEIGMQARFSDSVHAEGDAFPTGAPFDEHGRTQLEPSRVRLDVPLPFIVLRTGIRYRHPRPGANPTPHRGTGPPPRPHRAELFDVELDVIYESTSDFDEFEVVPQELVHLGFADVDVPSLPVAQHWKDSVNIRVGGTLNLLGGDLSLSAGFFWQSSASPIEYTHLVFPAWTLFGVGLGAAYRWRWLEIGVGYTHIFMPDRHVPEEDGQVFALRAMPEGGTFSGGPAVNAGDFSGSYDIVAISLAVQLAPRRQQNDVE